MYYTTGPASLVSFAAAMPLPRTGVLWLAARGMLDTAGALFALYTVIAVGLLLVGSLAGRRRPASAKHRRRR